MLKALTTEQAIVNQGLVAEGVFLTMAGMTANTLNAHVQGEEPTIASLLYYRRASEGTIVVNCDVSLAFDFTGRLMSLHTPTRVDRDVDDAMCELVNMIGGNLKGLLSPQTEISIPHLLEPGKLLEIDRSQRRLSRVCLEVERRHCCVTLYEGCPFPLR